MRKRVIAWVVAAAAILAVAATGAAAGMAPRVTGSAFQNAAHRCANDYVPEEMQALVDAGEDGYEPDDCPLLSHTLTGPMGHNFWQPDDEDWANFVAKPNLIYEIAAAAPANYPTEPHLQLYDGDVLIAENDYYFEKNAAIWWWNSGDERTMYVRVTELAPRPWRE